MLRLDIEQPISNASCWRSNACSLTALFDPAAPFVDIKVCGDGANYLVPDPALAVAKLNSFLLPQKRSRAKRTATLVPLRQTHRHPLV